ncbi:NINE protein [Clostridium sp.]
MSEKKCPSCGASIDLNATECKYCGESIANQSSQQQVQQTQQTQQYQSPQYQEQQYQSPQAPQYQEQQYQSQQAPLMYNPSGFPVKYKSKTTAGLLAIFLGGFGIHKFYLGKNGRGILYLVFCWTYIPSLIALVEGVIYLASSDENFYNKYVKH